MRGSLNKPVLRYGLHNLSYACIYQVVITLTVVKPRVWRRIQVPCSFTFWDLSVAIQDAMGWFGYTHHLFELKHPATGALRRIGTPDDERYPNGEILPAWDFIIAEYLSTENPTAGYVYDFQDAWKHSLVLEAIHPRTMQHGYPLCLDGRGLCPPEIIPGVTSPHVSGQSHPNGPAGLSTGAADHVFDPAEVWFDDPAARLRDFFT